ncbi:MAG: N-acetylmuramoyl-L-alanine amidase, partial [Planctomycetota bacterium]
ETQPEGARYGSFRRGLAPDLERRVRRRGWRLEELGEVVTQFVIHYDVCGTSRQCFKVLHDRRGLSVHFMLDVDGTLYQTLDLKERAWHAAVANDRSIGIEIANIGAYGSPDDDVLEAWYRRDSDGLRIEFPEWMKDTGIRSAGFVARPARERLIEGEVHERKYYQYDFTSAQYRALAHLVAALTRIFPKLRLDYPRTKDGGHHWGVLSKEGLAAYTGLLGHYHVTTRKRDPGPAFDWDRLLREAEALR